MMDENISKQMFKINLDDCIKHPNVPAVIRSLFIQLKNGDYLSPPKFFQDVSNLDLSILIALAEDQLKENEYAIEMLGLLTIALMTGEGITITEEDYIASFSVLPIFIGCEQLKRKGLIDVHYENWTMDAVHSLNPIATPK